MKQIILAAAIALSPLPLLAQEQEGEIEEGFSLMEEGARMLFRGMMQEMEPALDDFTGMAEDIAPALDMLASEMGPALMELMKTLDSVRYYQAPEILPNGDIIIRRREDAPVYVPQEGEEIDL